MNLESITNQMASSARAIQSLAQNVSEQQARRKPGVEDWSILEVVNHLADEEVQDFRTRLDVILHHPGEKWPPIDPEGWVTERRYNEQDLAHSLRRFLLAREESLAWLKGLDAPDWRAAYEAPFGQITAGDILAAWVAHDLLHLRQLVELYWAHTSRMVQPYGVRYAGEW
jgi:hypothetical protein